MWKLYCQHGFSQLASVCYILFYKYFCLYYFYFERRESLYKVLEYMSIRQLWCDSMTVYISHSQSDKFITFNIKGLNSPVKSKRVYTSLKNLNADITYLQETHPSDHELKREWFQLVFDLL